jgi:hypothetical protein
MVPRRKLINHGEAKATRTAAEMSQTAVSHARTWNTQRRNADFELPASATSGRGPRSQASDTC